MSKKNNAEMLWAYHRLKEKNVTQAERIRERLITENNGLVVTVASRMRDRCGEELEELLQWGRIGLDKAIQRFEPSRGVAFSSYAVPYIRGEMLHFLRDNWRGGYKVPRRWIEFHSTVAKLHREMSEGGRSLTPDDIAIKLLTQRPNIRSQQEPKKEAKRQWETIQQAMYRKPLVQFEEGLHQTELETHQENLDDEHADVRKAVSQLPEPEQSCFVAHFMEGLTHEAIAQQQNLTTADVQQHCEEALTWLRFRLGVTRAL
jgi:RNA polymerase sigma-B factor